MGKSEGPNGMAEQLLRALTLKVVNIVLEFMRFIDEIL